MSATKTTTDHNEIRRWVEDHGGQPASVEGTARDDEAAGLLRIDFPTGASNPPLQPIDWDDFFEKFDSANLAFLYQDEGGESTFCKFVDRSNADKPR